MTVRQTTWRTCQPVRRRGFVLVTMALSTVAVFGVVGLAVDTLSLDHGPSKDFKVHYAWLPSGRWGLENVANLDKVPPSGAMLVVGLAKVKDATGGPARLIALV